MRDSALETVKTPASKQPKIIPAAIYRVLAGAFVLVALFGLFFGYLGNFVSPFAHGGAILDPNLNLSLAEGVWLKGSLFGYVASVLKFYLFDGGFAKDYVLFEILNLAIALILVLAVLSSVVFFIVALCTKKATPRNLALASGVLVTLAYAFPLTLGMVTARQYSVEGASVGLELSGYVFYYDLPLLLTTAAALNLCIATIILVSVHCSIQRKRDASIAQAVDESSVRTFEQQMEAFARSATAPAAPIGEHTYPLPIVPRIMPKADARPDRFFETLTPREQEEFRALFILKTHGDFGLPKYEMGGDNAPFFQRVFAALGKFRETISDSLLEKIYDEVK